MPKPSIINIIGKTPVGEVLLQSAPHTTLLHEQLRIYFERTLGDKNTLSNTAAFQGALNTPANKVPELNMYEFEANQRVYEVAIVLMVSRTINKLYDRTFIPAWQRPKQGEIMKAFMEKSSWDGFIYEEPVDVSAAPNVSIVPIEIKSTMIHPTRSAVQNPDQLLRDSLPQYKEHFQEEGSICTVFVMPYTSEPGGLSFNLKAATVEMNKVVGDAALGSLCLLSFPKNEEGTTEITMHCYIVSKKPKLASNGKVSHAELTKMTFGKIS